MADADRWKSLGARRGHVGIVPYNTEWPCIFERESAAILAACRPWVVEAHLVGSTSVAGLAAKPILDIMPIMSALEDSPEAVSKMAALDYVYCGDKGIPGRFYFNKVIDGRTVVHAHMYQAGHPAIERHFVFRDYLRAHPETAREYETLKQVLASTYRYDRPAYTHAKDEFINRTIEAAVGAGP